MIKSTEESTIRKILKRYGINFKEQYRFIDPPCKDKGSLPFDFAIFDKDDNLLLIIEYDGRQHFFSYENTYYDSLEQIQFHDQIKTDYCLIHKIPLLRIPYYEKHNIRRILKNKFEELLIGDL